MANEQPYPKTGAEKSSFSIHSLLCPALAWVSIVIFLVLLSFMGNFAEWAGTCGVFLLFCIAFLTPAIRIFLWPPMRIQNSAFLAAASSFALSCMFVSIFVFLSGWNAYLLIIVLATIAGLNFLIWPLPQAPKITRKDILNQSVGESVENICFILILCSIAVPLLGIGKMTSRGMAYSSLLGYDFLDRVAYTMAVTRGIPIENPFFSGRSFPYHIFVYVLPAFAYKLLGIGANVQHILRAFSFLLAALLIGCFFAMVRAYGFSTKTKMWMALVSFFAYSYNGLAVVARDFARSSDWWLARTFQQKGLLDFSSVSHGIFRTLILEPHSVVVICIALILFTLVPKLSISESFSKRFVLSTVLLASSLGTEIFLGTFLTMWFGLTMLHLGYRSPGLRKHVTLGLLFLTLMLALSLALYSKMGIIGFAVSQSSLVIRPIKTFLLTAPALLPIELGPAVFFAGYFLIRNEWKNGGFGSRRFSMLCMLAIGFFCFFFVQHATDEVVVLRKSVMMLAIPLLLLSGMLFEEHFVCPRFSGRLSVLALLAIIFSLQTFIWDIRTFSAWDNPKLTAYVLPEDYKACKWIIENTPPESVIQSWISYSPEAKESEASAYSIIPQLAERRTAIGIWEIASYSRTETDTPAGRWKDIRDVLFRGRDAYEAWRTARKYSIDYIYVGAYERQQACEGIEKFSKAASMFELVYKREGVNVFKVSSIDSRQLLQDASVL